MRGPRYNPRWDSPRTHWAKDSAERRRRVYQSRGWCEECEAETVELHSAMRKSELPSIECDICGRTVKTATKAVATLGGGDGRIPEF